MGMDDMCEHGASGFCMLCCREGEGKGSSARDRAPEARDRSFCAYGRDPAVSASRECCYHPPSRGGLCREHEHLAGTKTDVYRRGAEDARRAAAVTDISGQRLREALP